MSIHYIFSPNKQLSSAHASSFKLVGHLSTDASNKSIEQIKQNDDEASKDFFNKRKRINNFQDNKLKDILNKIENKKQFIKQIEERYQDDIPEYKSNAFTQSKNAISLNPGVANHYYSPNVSTYVRMDISSNDRVREQDTRNDSSAVKVIPPSHPNVPGGIKKMKAKKSQKEWDLSRKVRGNFAKPEVNQRYLNSWEQGGIAQDDDIKEELSNDESTYEKKQVNEEGSVARRLLESMSRLAANDDENSDDSQNENEFIEWSLATFDLNNQVKKDGSVPRFGNRPYSPPFSQFSKD